MAQIPSEQLIKAVQKQTKKDLRRKRISHLLKGKIFRSAAHGPGVVPEREWNDMKKEALL